MRSKITSFATPVLVVAPLIGLFPACAQLSPDEPAVLSPEEQETQARAAADAQEMSLEQAIETEKDDPEWSQRAVNSWTQVFQKEGIREELKGIQLQDVACRTSLCRLELTSTDPAQGAAAFEQDLRKLLLFAPWQAPGFGRIENPDGRAPVAVIYMAREGYTLP
jgi:hypothetical protein